jgi:NAD(P)H-flavin reductase
VSVTSPTSSPIQCEAWKAWSATIQRLRRHNSSVFTIDLGFDDHQFARDFVFLPGQFNMLYVPGVGEAAISIAGVTSTGLLQHTIHAVGAVTGSIERGGVGMSLGIRGPFGTSWPVGASIAHGSSSTSSATLPKYGDIVIAAGGIGLAPLRSVVHHIAANRQDYGMVNVVIGARTPDDLLYQEEFDDWRSKRMNVLCTVDRASHDWKGQIGVVTLLLERLAIPNPTGTTFMTCGPEVMMRYAAKSALGRGISENEIYLTLERNMNCAIGLCGHCQLGPKFLCKDGPVFRYNSVSALLRVQEL